MLNVIKGICYDYFPAAMELYKTGIVLQWKKKYKLVYSR
jgi:hypothetical protein